MLICRHQNLAHLGIPPSECVTWIRQSFNLKKRATLPAKLSVHPIGTDFFNTMPCLLPPRETDGRQFFGVKVVSRIAAAVPSLNSTLLLYDAATGELLALMDADWITAMRTGAVATLVAQTFRTSNQVQYGMIGLGNTARASLLCLLDSEPALQHHVLLLQYKNQAESFIHRFAGYSNVTFEVVEKSEQLIAASDVIISCPTSADRLFCADDSAYKPGCVVIPVHSRGFQNCDLFFDRVVCDDTDHIAGFKNFNHFHGFCEMSDVLDGTHPGRQSSSERVLCYCIGLGLHDVFFASKFYERLQPILTQTSLDKETDKFWV